MGNIGRLVAGEPAEVHSWDRTARLAAASYILPALDGKALGDTGDLAAAAHLLNTDRNQAILALLTEAAAALNAHGITPLAIKGASHLVTDLWPTPGARMLGDIDLVVPVHRLEEAFAILSRLAGTPDADRGQPALIAIEKHCTPLQGEDWVAPIELHHAVLSPRVRRLAPAAKLFQRAERVRLGGAEILVPCPQDRALIAMLHGLVGDRGYAAPIVHMRDVLDLVFLMHRHGHEIDWAEIQAHLTRHGWGVLTAITGHCLERFAGVASPFAPVGVLARLDTWRWRQQLERNLAWRVGRFLNQSAFALRYLRIPGAPRRLVLEKLGSPATYARAIERYVFGRWA